MVAVLLADENRIMRQGTRALFEQQGDLEVIGEAGDGQSAVRLATALSPDVVVMDVAIGGMAAAEATRRIKSRVNAPQVIAFSTSASSELMREMFEAGASGYLIKDCDVTRLCTAVHEVAKGRVCIDVYRPGKDPAREAASTNHANDLSSREIEVLQLICAGMSTKQIGLVLSLSPKTIESHRANICAKLNITSIAGLTKYAISKGLTSADA